MIEDEALIRLLGYDRRRFWLENGWGIRFRITTAAVTSGHPDGVKYALTLHDVDRSRLLGFDNAHGMPRVQAYDHRHPFRRGSEMVPYEFQGADELIAHFFAAVEQACRREGVAFDFVDEDVETEQDDEADEPRGPS